MSDTEAPVSRAVGSRGASVPPDLAIDPPREDHVEWVELSAKAEHHLRWFAGILGLELDAAHHFDDGYAVVPREQAKLITLARPFRPDSRCEICAEIAKALP
jgi:hypothetical protein